MFIEYLLHFSVLFIKMISLDPHSKSMTYSHPRLQDEETETQGG